MAKKKILVIDEEPYIRDTLKVKLTSRGYQVLLSDNGKEAMKLAVKQLPDLIIMDILLSSGDAYKFCQKLRGLSRTKDIPLFILTSKSKDPETTFSYNIWAQQYITKPFSIDKLMKYIEKVLSK